MAEVVRMPKMSDTMTEGVISKWHKKVGDTVKTGDLIAEVETDKATMDFESYQEGVLLYIGAEEGKAVPIDAVIAVLGKEGEDYKALLEKESSAQSKPAEAPKEEKAAAPKEETKAASKPAEVKAAATKAVESKTPVAAPVSQESSSDG